MKSPVMCFRGSRKTSVAVARMSQKSGIVVNGRKIEEYFGGQAILLQRALKALVLLQKDMAITVNVHGSGLSSQAGAIQLAISKLLASMQEENRVVLNAANLLRCDTRQVERKKVGLYKARKKPPYNRR